MKRKNKKGAGRPREHYLDLPVYDSMQQMAGATGIPLEVIKYAKAQGGKFVEHSRCNLGEFLKWFFAKADRNDDADWGVRDKKASALIKEVKLKRLNGSVVDFTLADNFIRNLIAQFVFAELKRLRYEFPGSLKGKDEVAIAKEVERQMDLVEKSFRGRLEEWSAEVDKQEDKE